MTKSNEFILPTNNRLLSLDILRGLTIAGMIIVNDPGSWATVYPMLRHADWHGITPTDLVFPFFLFIVGISISISYTKRIKSGAPKGKLIRKILRRTLTIFLLGVFLWIYPKFDFSEGGIHVRIPGVLQRIALVFGIASILFLYFNKWKQQVWLGIICLVGYWALMALIPVPIDAVIRGVIESGEVQTAGGMLSIVAPTEVGTGFIAANFEPGTNLEAWIDRAIIPLRLYQYTWDPEGLLSTLPSIGTAITGILIGQLWLNKDLKAEKRLIWMFAIGFIWFTLGNLWQYAFPINKNLWTSSYVLYTSGLCTMLFATCIWLVDMQGYKRWAFPFVVFGTNSIAAYVLHGMLSAPAGANVFNGVSFKGIIYNTVTNIGLSGNFASLVWALFYTWLIYLIVWVLYKRKIFLKI